MFIVMKRGDKKRGGRRKREVMRRKIDRETERERYNGEKERSGRKKEREREIKRRRDTHRGTNEIDMAGKMVIGKGRKGESD